jgi:putative membrane protein
MASMPFRDVLLPLASSRTAIHVAGLAILVGVYSCLPILKEYTPLRDVGDIPSQFHAALSLVLGWLLVFRTNSAYARWWEARTLWGALVNASRNLSVKLRCLTPLNQDDAKFLAQTLASFPEALKDHLRKPARANVSTRADVQSSEWDHQPARLVMSIYRWIERARSAENIDGDELRILDVELSKFLEICGACERISRTPIVRSYRTFARQCIFLFLVTLPWGIWRDFGWWTAVLSTITAYFMLGMEIVAEHVEDPFGLDEDDLDLEGLCQVIHRSVHEIFQSTA